MPKKHLVACVGVAALLLAGAAMAGVPCASTSTVDVSVGHKAPVTSCTSTEGAFCPLGDEDTVHVNVVIQDCYGNVLAGRSVSLDVPVGFLLKNPPAPVNTDGLGEASFTFSDCSGCGFAQYGVTVDGVSLLGNLIYQASMDHVLPLDKTVGLGDFTSFAAVYGLVSACHDYNCDGGIGLGDFTLFASHYGH